MAMLDSDKPLSSGQPIGKVCPKCGSGEFKKVKARAMVAFADDRVCKQCSTRYTPPTPIWARPLFALIGLMSLSLGLFIAYGNITEGKTDGPRLMMMAVFVPVGLGCIYKAFTR